MKQLTIKMDQDSLLVLLAALEATCSIYLNSKDKHSIVTGVCVSLFIKFKRKSLVLQDEYRVKILEYQALSLLDAIQSYWNLSNQDPHTQAILSQYSTFLNKHIT